MHQYSFPSFQALLCLCMCLPSLPGRCWEECASSCKHTQSSRSSPSSSRQRSCKRQPPQGRRSCRQLLLQRKRLTSRRQRSRRQSLGMPAACLQAVPGAALGSASWSGVQGACCGSPAKCAACCSRVPRAGLASTQLLYVHTIHLAVQQSVHLMSAVPGTTRFEVLASCVVTRLHHAAAPATCSQCCSL